MNSREALVKAVFHVSHRLSTLSKIACSEVSKVLGAHVCLCMTKSDIFADNPLWAKMTKNGRIVTYDSADINIK